MNPSVNYTGDDPTAKFRIRIESVELIVKRWVIDSELHKQIEKRMEKQDLKLLYNRIYYKECRH